jgi:hypothetical protein
MTELAKHIAEIEGVRTPTVKRSKKEVEKALEDFTQKRTASKKEKAAKAAAEPKAATEAKPKTERTRSTPAKADIARVQIAKNPGNISEAGYEESSKRLHVMFSKGGIYEFPNTTAQEWKDLEATFVMDDVDTGSYFRKAFRGRAGGSRRVFDTGEVNEAAPAETPAAKKSAKAGKAAAVK